MVPTKTMFREQEAPCGRVVDGEHYEDRDEESLLTDEFDYACGCRRICHEYHDGSVARKVINHDGSVLVDELLAAQ